MTFIRLHDLITYLVVGTSFLVLLLSGELATGYWAVVAPFALLSVLVGGVAHRESPWAQPMPWNVVVLVALAGLVAAGLATGDWLLYALYFTTLLVIAKLFQRQTAADYQQLYALSFLVLIAGAVVNPGLSFALCYLLYVIFLSWALLMLHLRRDTERLAALLGTGSTEADLVAARERVRALFTPRFLASTSALALLIVFISVGVFLLFPRLGLGFFGQHLNRGAQVSGFSSTVELGNFGTMKQDQTVIMRVELPEVADPVPYLPLRLRGIAFDTYDGKRWSKSHREIRDVVEQLDDFWRIPDTDRLWPEIRAAGPLLMRVYLEQMEIGRKTIFAENRLRWVRDLHNPRLTIDPRRRTRFHWDSEHDVIYTGATKGPLRYEVKSYRIPREAERLREAGTELDEDFDLKRYTKLPDTLNPDIVALAERVTAGQKTDYDRAIAIEQHLVGEYKYSLAGGHDDADPLSDFLFSKKAGHCEYFATAFVVLARAAHVPARLCGGFFGGQHNPVGNYVAMRQADAHSWAEVYFPGTGWVVFEPTPPSGALAPEDTGFLSRLRQYMDSLQLAWYKWVIRWDLEAQLGMLRELGQKLGGAFDFLTPSFGRSGLMRDVRNAVKGTAVLIVGGVLLVLIGGLAGWLWRRRGRSGVARPPSSRERRRELARARRWFHALSRVARRLGVEVKAGTTSSSVVHALRHAHPMAAEPATAVVRVYEAVVFGDERLESSAEARCREAIASLKRLHVTRAG